MNLAAWQRFLRILGQLALCGEPRGRCAGLTETGMAGAEPLDGVQQLSAASRRAFGQAVRGQTFSRSLVARDISRALAVAHDPQRRGPAQEHYRVVGD